MSQNIEVTPMSTKAFLNISLSIAQQFNGMTIKQANSILDFIKGGLGASSIVNFNPLDYPDYDADFDPSHKCHL